MTRKTLKRTLGKMAPSAAPGLDAIQPCALKILVEASADFATILINVVNTILYTTRDLPASLRESELVYLYKEKGSPLDLNNYRGIALQSTIYKLATAHRARCMQEIADEHGLINTAQAAARQGGQADLHATTLINVIAHAKRNGKELHVTTCDIAKAFDTVPPESINEALALHGFPPEVIANLEKLDASSTAKARTPFGHSEPVQIQRGCKQGCPLSPLKFCLFMDIFIRWYEHQYPQHGYEFELAAEDKRSLGTNTRRIRILGYMDDIAFIGTSAAQNSHQVELLSRFLAAHGMRLNPSKCVHTYTPARGLRRDSPRAMALRQPLHPEIDGARSTIRTATPTEPIDYLGYKITMTLAWRAHTEKLESKVMAASVKVAAAARQSVCHTVITGGLIQQDVMSVMDYYVGAARVPRATLERLRTHNMDIVYRRAGLPHTAARIAMCGPAHVGGIGPEDPLALDCGQKAATLLRAANSNTQEGHIMRANLEQQRHHKQSSLAQHPPSLREGTLHWPRPRRAKTAGT